VGYSPTVWPDTQIADAGRIHRGEVDDDRRGRSKRNPAGAGKPALKAEISTSDAEVAFSERRDWALCNTGVDHATWRYWCIDKVVTIVADTRSKCDKGSAADRDCVQFGNRFGHQAFYDLSSVIFIVRIAEGIVSVHNRLDDRCFLHQLGL